jgi:hypothetical protein
MKKDIILKGRDSTSTLVYLKGNDYLFSANLNFRIMKTEDKINFIDPAGGPKLSNGGSVNGFYIKDIRFSEENPRGYILTLISNRNREYTAKAVSQTV